MMNTGVNELEDSVVSVSSSVDGSENAGFVILEDTLSSLCISDSPEDEYLGKYATLESILSNDDDSNLTNEAKSKAVTSSTISVLPEDLWIETTDRSREANNQFKTFPTSSISSSTPFEGKPSETASSEQSKSFLSDGFNKKLYLPKAHELPARAGSRALSAFCRHKDAMIKTLRNLHNSLENRPREDISEEQPSGLTITLFDYQLRGLSWLLWRESEFPPGGIVADDMGLGKTIQMISLILKSKELSQSPTLEKNIISRPLGECGEYSQIDGGTLIIVPSCVLGQWSSEINKRVIARYLTVCVYHGQSRIKSAYALARFSVVLTTYGTVQRASDFDPLGRVKWDRIILDEAHVIRNHRSKTAKAVFNLKGTKKWVLTGTPIQNKTQDYYAFMNFLQLKPFNDLAVWKEFVDNKKDSGFHRLAVISKAIMLRRTKEQIKNTTPIFAIGDKRIENIVIELDEEEFVMYERLSYYSKALLLQFIQEQTRKDLLNDGEWNALKSAEGRRQDTGRLCKNFESMKEVKTLQILVVLLRLRQLCCHPSLTRKMLLNREIDPIEGFDNSQRGINTSSSSLETYDQDAVSHETPIFSEERPSSKINAVIELISNIFDRSTTDKIIIVSQWTSFLSLIEKFIRDRLGMKCTSFNGNIPATKRQLIVDEFNSANLTNRILLLSLTAGGIGLNLIGANHIVFVDLHWNPQWENQAADRIYRFGQTKNVYVYKIMCKYTIEERILRLQQSKISLANGILNGSTERNTADKLSINDLKVLLFGIEGQTASSTLPPSASEFSREGGKSTNRNN